MGNSPLKEKPDSKGRVSSKGVKALVDGFARLVEGQRRFADEMGLPYSRIFHDGFESFKDAASVEEVIYAWITPGSDGESKINVMVRDLMEHQLALIEALGSKEDEREKGWAEKTFSSLFSKKKSTRQGTHRGYMEVTIPAFVVAYTRAREQESTSKS